MKKSFCLAFILTSLVALCLTGGCKVDVETPDYNLHTVTFECNGGSSISPQILVNGTTATEPKDPSKNGGQFLGWYADPQFNTPFDFGTPITQDVTVYAKWVYKVYFYDYYGKIWKTVDVAHGYKVERPNDNPIPNEWYRDFDNWFVNSERSTVFDYETPITESIEIYAGYKPNKWYTVTFETNGGNAIPPQQVGHADKVIKPENPTKDGYTFIGWYSDAECNFEYDFTNEVVDSKTLYAKWFEFAATKYRGLPAGTDGTAGPSWTYVEFGDWPQTIKAENVTVDENESVEVGMFTYYKGSDGAWYVKEKERASRDDFKYSDGTDVAQEAAESYKYFKVEPIKWRVLTTDYDGKKLLLAEDILLCSYWQCQLPPGSPGDYCYEYCQLRAMLNGKTVRVHGLGSNTSFFDKGFLQTAFPGVVKNIIVAHRIDNSSRSMIPDSESSNYWEKMGYNTLSRNYDDPDRILVLSVQEVTKEDYGFCNNDSRQKSCSDYVKACGLQKFESMREYNNNWWLRSSVMMMSDRMCRACYVDNRGVWGYHSYEPSNIFGIVPALCVEN